jgi:hypothetical protein
MVRAPARLVVHPALTSIGAHVDHSKSNQIGNHWICRSSGVVSLQRFLWARVEGSEAFDGVPALLSLQLEPSSNLLRMEL